jgi:hypothetical protein
MMVDEFQSGHKCRARKICLGMRIEGGETLTQVELEGAAPGTLLKDDARAAIAEWNTSDVYLTAQQVEIALRAGKIVVQKIFIL